MSNFFDILIIMEKKKPLSASLEDYLEVIFHLETKNKVARVKDIAEALSVQMPSVSGAMRALKERNLVSYEKNSYINLTEEGQLRAKTVIERHSALEKFLLEVLQLSSERACELACLIEHDIDVDTAQRLARLASGVSKGELSPQFLEYIAGENG